MDPQVVHLRLQQSQVAMKPYQHLQDLDSLQIMANWLPADSEVRHLPPCLLLAILPSIRTHKVDPNVE